MGRRKQSQYEESRFLQAMEFSRELLRGSGIRLDMGEFEGNAGLVYWEALGTYPAYEGCCGWDSYFAVQIQELIQEMSRQRSRQIRLESSLSLDQPCGEARRPAAEFVGLPQGDFTNGVALRDYLSRLEAKKQWLAKQYCNKETDEDILARTKMDRRDLALLKHELRKDMERYLTI